METHENPQPRPSDGPNIVKLRDLPVLFGTLIAFDPAKARRRIMM
jgi:3-deoxy-D-manno-octulosonic acid (KDO) 8-phosphate synthase